MSTSRPDIHFIYELELFQAPLVEDELDWTWQSVYNKERQSGVIEEQRATSCATEPVQATPLQDYLIVIVALLEYAGLNPRNDSKGGLIQVSN